MNTFNKCFCGNNIENERLELGLKICKSCAFQSPVKKVKGIMTWAHKTSPEIQIVSESVFEMYSADTERVGQSSILRKKMDSGGRLI